MIYRAKVVSLSDLIEEEVVLELCCSEEVTCFASYCPFSIEEGQAYLVELNLFSIDGFDLHEEEDRGFPPFSRVDSGFSYVVRGALNGGVLNAGGVLFDEERFLVDFEYLNGKYVSVRVDRINACFIGKADHD
jgi:hypothetical protein